MNYDGMLIVSCIDKKLGCFHGFLFHKDRYNGLLSISSLVDLKNWSY